MKISFAIVVIALLTAAPGANAQWEKKPHSSVKQLRTGEFDLKAPAPKTRAGRPDLSGVWLTDQEPLPPEVVTVEIGQNFPRHFINAAADFPPADFPIQPWAAELFGKRAEGTGADDPAAHCRPSGGPVKDASLLPFKIVQSDPLIVVLYEEDSTFRQIFLDGRKPVPDPLPRYLGYSSGHWDGATLVVDTVGFIDQLRLDALGHPLTDKLRVTERFRRVDSGHLETEITVDDPGAFTKPFTYTVRATLVPDDDLLEYFCADNEKDAQHYQ
jgi:hypothetical protein